MSSAQLDYYQTLEVARDADAAALKSSYRKLAMQYHPDRNPGNAGAEAKFKAISEAYDCLKDPQKRAAYDRYGDAPSPKYNPVRPVRPVITRQFDAFVTMYDIENYGTVTVKPYSFSIPHGIRDGESIRGHDPWTSLTVHVSSSWQKDDDSRLYTRNKDEDLIVDYQIEKKEDLKRGKRITLFDHPGIHTPSFTLNTNIKKDSLWKVSGGGLLKHPSRRSGPRERGDLYVRFKMPKSLWHRRSDVSSWSDGETLLMTLIYTMLLVVTPIAMYLIVSAIS